MDSIVVALGCVYHPRPASLMPSRGLILPSIRTLPLDDVEVAWLSEVEQFAARVTTQVSHEITPWVFLTGSMTARLAQEFGQMPKVFVHHSGPSGVEEWEANLLGGGCSTNYFARHIALKINDVSVVVARSIAIEGSAAHTLLGGLSTTPLAKLLFEDARWQREQDVVPLMDDMQRPGRACTWVDQQGGDRLIVEEFFLFECGE